MSSKRRKRHTPEQIVKTLYVAKSSPWEHGYIESFNSRFRQELLERELLLGLEDAR
ncbi:hypothetical protein Pla111_30720 [Botrimarina hoheduenensis]|uniref:Integrase catalytic domain-containing protein n=1 Tax=Botrimarina hoheduenensis TaxID=2528000 RepID=A0A5C5VRY7_9BACT|nr:hypothetical protein Pla111_30720 [Botrimarina hoheduenensis]